MTVVSTTHVDGIAVVSINNPPVNVLSHGVRRGLVQALDATEADPSVLAVVLVCVGRTFIAGADVGEFGKPAQAPHLPDLVLRLEACAKPWIAALHGTALGGGLEVALGCRYRIAAGSARLGLPEVHLGLIPGAGGTVRLPRLVGAPAALDMIAGGKPVSARAALAMGLIDRLAPGDLSQDAVAFAREVAVGPSRAGLLARPAGAPPDQGAWARQISAIRKKAGRQISPLAAIEAVQNALTLPAAQALAKERDLFISLKSSPQSHALRHVFFAERSVAKISGLRNVAPRPVHSVGIIGGGTMGAGIAATCLLAGLSVTLVEQDSDRVNAGLARIRAILADSHRRGIVDADRLAAMRAGLVGSSEFAGLARADLIIEAVFEDMAVKKAVFLRLEAVARPDAVLASNTSYLDVGEIAEVLADPSRLLGLHFFSPAHIMKLLEVVRPAKVADDVLATGLALAKRLGKIAVPSGVCDGFIANRMMSAYRREAEHMVKDGAWPQDVDRAMVDFGFGMGIFAMSDLAGLDIGWAARKRRGRSRDGAERHVDIADRICELGRFGRKTGAGWYDYGDGPRGRPDGAVDEIILAASERAGIARRPFGDDEIMARILAVMQAEGRAILQHNIAASAEAVDVAMINGFGFPRWRGGPMYMMGRCI